MKQLRLIKPLFGCLMLLGCLPLAIMAQATAKPFTHSFALGTGIAMSEPSCRPFVAQYTAHYRLTSHFSLGAGTGLSVYEKPLIPLFGTLQYRFNNKKLHPYAACHIGGAWAIGSEANGGFYWAPELGIQYRLTTNRQLFFAVGYAHQELQRVKHSANSIIQTAFQEKLSHQSVLFKFGITL